MAKRDKTLPDSETNRHQKSIWKSRAEKQTNKGIPVPEKEVQTPGIPVDEAFEE